MGQLVKEARHPEGGLGALATFVADVSAGAVNRLLQIVAGQHAEQHGNAGFEAQFADRQADGAVDVLVMGRFAANHRPQTEDRAILSGSDHRRGGHRELKRPGDPGHVDGVVRHAIADEGLRGAGQQARGDGLVVARDDDRKTTGDGGEMAFEGAGHG